MNKTTKLTVSSLAAFGAAGAALFGALPSDASTTTTTVAASNVPPLSPKLAFVANRWGCDAGGTLNGKQCTRGAMVPKGWKWTKLSRENAKFSDKSGTQFIRLALGPQTVSTAKAVARKQAALRGTRNLKVLGVATVRVPGQPGNVYSTIVYTYTDSARTNRWVATRYLDNYGQNGRTAHIELTVGGRVQDQAGLKTVLARATTSVYEAG